MKNNSKFEIGEYLKKSGAYDILYVGKRYWHIRCVQKRKPQRVRPLGFSSLFAVELPRLVVVITSV